MTGLWDNGTTQDVGAVTFGSPTAGVHGTISAANSLIGSHADDRVGAGLNGLSVMALTNGNYIVRAPSWDNGTIVDAGTVAFGSGTTGIAGTIDATNSLVGSHTKDFVGS